MKRMVMVAVFIIACSSVYGQEDLVKELIDILFQSENMEEVIKNVASQGALQFHPVIQAKIGRELTDKEKQRLALCLYNTIKRLIDTLDLEEILKPTIEKYLTDDDLKAIYQFYQTPTGKKYLQAFPILIRELRGSEQQFRLKISEKEAGMELLDDMKREFPDFFE
jgi:hypothetical protein